jgi:type I restriction enzyme S subunit
MHLGDFIELKRGYDLPKKQRTAGSVPLVSSAGISDYHSEAKVCGPGVVTGRYGTIGEVFYVEEDFWPLNTTLYVRDFKGNDPRFTYYFLKTIDYLQYSDKAAVPGVNRNHLHTAEISVPESVTEQRRIASVLSALDDKIQLNHQINQTLEQMAQAIFKSWFVDFEPVKAKIAARERWHALQPGNDPASPVCYAGELDGQPIDVDLDTYMNLAAMQAISGKDADQLAQMKADQPEQYAELYATAKLFPSAMQDSELGEIPEGWEVRQLGDCLNTLETGGRPKGGVKGITDGVPSVGAENIIGIGNYDYGKEKLIPEEFFNKLKRGVVEHLDCLLYKDGGKPGDFKPRVSMFGCGFPYDKFAINEHVFRLRSDRLGQPFLYCQIGHERVLADLRHRGAKAAIPGINQTDVKTIRIVCPSTEVLGIFHQVAEGLFVSILTRAKENLKLSGTRDTLLPKLLSGELTLPDTEEPQTECQDVAHG